MFFYIESFKKLCIEHKYLKSYIAYSIHMPFSTIEHYNQYLIKNMIKINISTYIKNVNRIFYNIDDVFMEQADKQEFCVPQDALIKHNITPKFCAPKNIENMLKNTYGLVENRDYVHGVNDQYLLTPKAFKTCTMHVKGIDYYNLLEDCIRYYDIYINEMFLKKEEEQLEQLVKENRINSEIFIKKINETNRKIDMVNAYVFDKLS